MEKDILAHMKALTTQASDPDPVAAAPPVQTPLEDASTAASRGVNVGQKSVGQKENDEMRKMSVLRLCPSAEAGSPLPEVAVAHTVLEGTSSAANGGGIVGKKKRRKRRNRKERKALCLPWPLTIHTWASSAAPVLDQTSATGALAVANNVRQESREQRGTGKKENTSVLSQSWKAPAGTLLPAASPVQPPHQRASLAANGEIKRGQKSSHKRRNKKSRKAVASPWPLTVQAWASFTASAPVQTTSAGTSLVANNEVNVWHQSRGQSGDADKMSLFTLCQSVQAGAPYSAEAPGETSLEGTPPATTSGEKVGKRRHKRRNRKDKNALAHPWPLTVQAWASFTAVDPVQTLFQEECFAASTGVNVGQRNWSQLVDSEKETKSILPWSVWEQADAPFSATAPLQTSLEEAPFLDDIYFELNKPIGSPTRVDEEQLQESAEQDLEYCQGWRNAEKYQGDQDFWECTVMNSARQVECHYCGEFCSQERMEALTLAKACAHMSPSVMGMQETEKESVESQTLWMGKWESC